MKEIATFIDELRLNGIGLELNGNELDILLFDENIDTNYIDKIRLKKTEIIEYINSFSDDKNFIEIPKIKFAESYALSDAQRRLWVLSQFEGGSTAYNMPASVELRKEINIENLKKAIISTIERHEILRTVFKIDISGEPYQFITPVQEFNFLFDYKDFRNTDNKELLVSLYIEDDSFKPFDLVHGPLIRAGLLQTEDDCFIFYYNIHHIIFDGWSMGVLSRDIWSFYEFYEKAIKLTLPELKIQYKDFASWQLSQLHSEIFLSHRDYWKKCLAGDIPIITLPACKTRPNIQTHNGLSLSTCIDANTTDHLKYFINEKGGTLFMVLLASWNVLLYRYTGNRDIILGSPVAGRDHLDLLDQIGFFVNTLCLRTNIDPIDSFDLLFSKVKENTIKAYEHQNYPFDRLIQDIASVRDTSRNFIFDIMLTLQNMEENIAKQVKYIDEFEQVFNQGYCVSKFDLDITFQEIGNFISFNIIFNSDVYEEGTISRLMADYKRLLSLLLLHPYEQIGKIDFLLADEKQKLLATYNNKNINYLHDTSIIALFEKQVEKNPNNIAIIFNEKKITYLELNKKVNQLAHYLKDNYFIKSNDLVGIKLDRDEWSIISILAVLKLHAAYLPIDLSNPLERVLYIEKHSQCKLIFSRIEFDLFFNRKDDYPDSNIKLSNSKQRIAYVIYTSGTSGNPKGVVISMTSMLDYILSFRDYFKIQSNDRIIHQSSLSFDIHIEEIFPSLVSGASVYITKEPGNDIVELNNAITKEGCTILSTTPLVINELNKIENKIYTLKCLISGGDCLMPSHIANLFGHFDIFNTYGPSESTVCATYFKIDKVENASLIGKPINNRIILLLDENLMLVPIGHFGEIYIGGEGLFNGYLNDKDLTEKVITTLPFSNRKFYKTGDIGKWNSEGNLQFIGRKDFQVKIRGYRVELKEIELKLIEYNEIDDVFVLLFNDRSKDELKKLVAFYTSKIDIVKNDLRSFLFGKLPDYMIPQTFIQLGNLPRNFNGKIDIEMLNDFVIKNDHTVSEYIAPLSRLEENIIKIVSELFDMNHSSISVHQNFFDLGLNSIHLIKFKHFLLKELNIDVEMVNFFEYPTIRLFSDHCEKFHRKESNTVYSIDQKEEVISNLEITNLFNK